MGSSRPSPGPSSPKKRRFRCEESRLKAACAALRALSPGKQNYWATAQEYDVNNKTLQRRFEGKHKSPRDAHENQQHLTKVQEEVLVEWCIYHGDEGRPWSSEQIRIKVQKLTGKKPSANWVTRFRGRHKEALNFKAPAALETKRAKAFCPAGIASQFKKLGEARQQFRYKRWNIYNFDETGMQIGGGRKRTGKKYFFSRHLRTCYKQRDESLELVTVIECASADGTMMTPGFIFEGKHTYHADWFLNHPNVSVGLTENGWTDDHQCFKWFTEVFIPEALRRRDELGDSSDYILLIFDGHGSHLTDILRERGIDNEIHFFKLRAHTTHKTQPLDVGIFGSMSKDWLGRMEEIVEDTGSGLQKWDFVNEYMAIRAKSVTEQHILSSFRKTGIEPFNPDVFTEADFAPSRTSSSQAQLPASVPTLPRDQPMVEDTPAESQEMLELPDQCPVDEPPEAESVSQGCAIGADGTLLDASEIQWFLDANDNVPISSTILPDDPPTLSPPSPSPEIPVVSSVAASVETTPTFPSETWGLKLPSFQPVIPNPRWSDKRKLQAKCEDFDKLLDLYRSEFALRQRREMEVGLTRQELDRANKQLFLREQKETRKDRQFQSDAEFLMGPEALAAWEESKTERANKVQAEEEKKAAKEAAERETLKRRQILAQNPDVRYKGSLKSKRKAELGDIAFLLAFPVDGTIPQIVNELTRHLVENPEIQNDLRFKGLYASLSTPGPVLDVNCLQPGINDSRTCLVTSDENSSSTPYACTTASSSSIPPQLPARIPLQSSSLANTRRV